MLEFQRWTRWLIFGLIGVTLPALSGAAQPASLTAPSAPQGERVRKLWVKIGNPNDFPRTDELVVLSVREIKKVAPDFDATSFLVVDPSSSTGGSAVAREAGAAHLDGPQLPSQADDLNGDGQPDEICFVISLAAKQVRRVELVYGAVAPMRASYPKRSHAKFSKHYEGLGWESDIVAYRLYFDARNGLDVFGKHAPRLSLDKFAEEGYYYHGDSEWGRDVMKVGDSLGVGSLGLWSDGKLVKVADVANRSWRLISDGPVRSIIELHADGWKVAGKSFNLTMRFTAMAGQHWTKVDVTLHGPAEGLLLATGLVKHDQTVVLEDKRRGYLATWGQQVEATPGNLGLAVMVPPDRLHEFTQDSLNYLTLLSLNDSGHLTYYLCAAWDKEQGAMTSVAQWKVFLEQSAARLRRPVTIKFAD
ncbi:MAG: DUF4861 domain-containing protein [Terriglobia bacterium]